MQLVERGERCSGLRTMNYTTWALIGMTGYSFTTLLMKLAIRDGKFSHFLVLACATVIVCSSAWIAVLWRG